MLHRPAPVVEPRPWIGKPDKLDTEEIRGRALQAGGRCVEGCERGHPAGARVEGRAHYLARGGLVQHALHGADIAPKPKQIELALAQGFPDRTPRGGVDRRARPAAMRVIRWGICE